MQPKKEMLMEDTETTINFCRYHIGDWAEVYTTDKTVMKRFEKFCEEHPEYGKLISEDSYSMTFSVHPKCAALYPRAPRNVNLTEEQRQTLVDRMRELRQKQLGQT